VSRSVLDSSAVLALLQVEAGEERVRQAIREGAVISSVNVAEVVTRFADLGQPEAEIRRQLEGVNVDVIDFDAEAAIHAGLLRVPTKALGLSVGDRACLALAEHLGVPAVTADRPWATLSIGIQIEVIR
jgi:PIN domain nuclease of toxin-antitoxin system